MRHILNRIAMSAMLGLLGLTPAVSADPAPRLVLQITVDQLRGDLIARDLDRMGNGGFRYLLDEGVAYLDAHHAHANTETIVGHATLATGAHPAAHGMIGNVWFDRGLGRLVYNVEDGDFPILGAGAGVDKSGEIDPTQKAAGTDGRSPRAIMTSTFGDELAIAQGGTAKIFGVSVKDRGAISMAGHAGKAFWFSKKIGEFITSSYYYDRYPGWVTAWNARRLPFDYAGKSWELLYDRASYRNGDRDDLDYETALPGFGRVFPHPFGPADGKLFTTLLTTSPAGDALTVDFAKTLIDAEELGRDAVTDYLSVSLSSTDYVGHLFGPSSLETEDQILRLDRLLADLFAFVDDRVGLDRTLIALSADHGAADPPGYLAELGVPARYLDPAAWNREPGLARLRERFGLGAELISAYFHPYVYLDREAIAAADLDQEAVERAVAEEIMRLPGVGLAVSSSALANGDYPEMPIIRSVLNNYNPSRSGDVFVVFEPHSFINDFDGLTVAAHHGSPWRYDTFVPLIFAGYGLQARNVARRVETVDLAPTLSAIVGLKPPSGAAGSPLAEVLEAVNP
ncbi:MAG: alkaline phosphatase family protein [Rhodospirillales bacterium]|nr:MAG: alkaline phosphatase family protein [Rhodospirillales bacterium]